MKRQREMAELARERRLVPALNLQKAAPYALLVIVAFLVLYPLGMLFYGAFSTKFPFEEGNQLTLQNFKTAFSNPQIIKALLVTVAMLVPRVGLAILLATAFAWILARTNTPAKRLLEGLMVFMFFLPFLPWVMAWKLLAAPGSGFLNQLIFSHLPGPDLNVYTYAGVIILGAVRIAPLMYLFVAPAFKAMDASLEESSRMSGANALTTIRRINVPLAMPALLSQAIMATIAVLSSFDLEFLIGNPGGIWVYTTMVWRQIFANVVPAYGVAAAMSLIVMALTVTLVVVQWRILGAKIFVVVTGRGYQAKPYELGRWRWATFSFILGFFLLFVLLPLVVLLLNTFAKTPGFYAWDWDYYTLRYWRNTFAHGFMVPLKNTIILGVSSATGAIVISGLISYIVTRTKLGIRKPLDLLSWTPFTLPDIVMAVGYFWAYVFLPIPIYGTVWVLILAMITRGLPFAGRVLNSTMVQIGPELEESSRIHGASWFYTFRRVMLPLLRPAFVYSWILLFVIAVGDLQTVIFLASPGSRTLSTTILSYNISGGMGTGPTAIVLSLVLTGICVVGYVVAQRFSPRGKMT